jgi:CheY-like chemotaxis protein
VDNSTSVRKGQPIRFLVVDDDPVTAELMVALLHDESQTDFSDYQ